MPRQMLRQTIVASGGSPDARLMDYVLGLAGGSRVLVDGAASPTCEGPLDLPGELTPVSFYPWPPENLRELALSQDVILVCGGNTANLLAVWRVHGFDSVPREAWESGVVPFGWSAGMICWFEACVTGSFGPQLAGMRDGLGLLPGSACPHYDGEERRRPVYTSLVADGFPPGLRTRQRGSRSRPDSCREPYAVRRRRLNSANHASVRSPIQTGVRRT